MRYLSIGMLLVMAGCNETKPDTPLRTSSPVMKAESGARFEVERVGVFADDLSYGGRRGIYILKDTQTGKEYVGVSGVGISELGSHTTTTSTGKTQITTIHPDER